MFEILNVETRICGLCYSLTGVSLVGQKNRLYLEIFRYRQSYLCAATSLQLTSCPKFYPMAKFPFPFIVNYS